jgi:hypothetical protein
METKDVLTLLGIFFSFFVGTVGLVISLRNSRKTIFINSITSSRIKYIQDIRNSISEYCGLFYRYKVLYDNDPKLSNEKIDILKSLDKLKYQIILYLNPEDKIWDNKIIGLIETIRKDIGKDQEQNIKKLIRLTQYLLKLEWEGAKLESKKGLVSDREKRVLNDKFYRKYLDSVKKSELD